MRFHPRATASPWRARCQGVALLLFLESHGNNQMNTAHGRPAMKSLAVRSKLVIGSFEQLGKPFFHQLEKFPGTTHSLRILRCEPSSVG